MHSMVSGVLFLRSNCEFSQPHLGYWGKEQKMKHKVFLKTVSFVSFVLFVVVVWAILPALITYVELWVGAEVFTAPRIFGLAVFLIVSLMAFTTI